MLLSGDVRLTGLGTTESDGGEAKTAEDRKGEGSQSDGGLK